MGVGIAAAVIGAAAIGAGATAYAAKSSADSAAAANAANQAIAQSDRALQYQQFLQSRGAQGSALLPMYPSFTSAGVEQNLGNQAYATYLAEQAALGAPKDQIAQYQDIVSGLTPSMVAGDQLVNQLFSGQLEKQQEANIAPVLAARGAVATAQKQGILEGLQARLNALSADRTRQGYTGGGSTFQKNLLTGATIPALQAAGTVGAEADLANAADVAGIKQQAINTKLSNLSLPLTQAGNRLQMSALPATAAGTTYVNSLAPFNWFKLNQQTNVPFRSPYVQPVPGIGSIVGTGVAQGASTLGNYFANRALANQINAPSDVPPPSSSQNVNYPISQADQQMIEYYGLGG